MFISQKRSAIEDFFKKNNIIFACLIFYLFSPRWEKLPAKMGHGYSTKKTYLKNVLIKVNIILVYCKLEDNLEWPSVLVRLGYHNKMP